MKTLDLFVVELEKPFDEIVLQNGAKLFVDNKFNEFKWRVTEGPVVCAPSSTILELRRRYLVLPPPSRGE